MKRHTDIKGLSWRILFYLVGQFLCGCGIGLSVNARLGVMPGSSLAFACSQVWGMDLGLWAFVLFFLMMLVQILLLGKEFRLRDVSQLISALISSAFISLGNHITSFWTPKTYPERFAELLLGLVVFALSIAIYIDTDLLINAPERTTLAISKRCKVSLGMAKIIMDCTLVISAVLVTYIGIGKIVGVREGTFISAFFVGIIMDAIHKKIAPGIKKLCFGTAPYLSH